jgi:aromatic ring-opening dioxygenase catalytic subunit (LigB family)
MTKKMPVLFAAHGSPMNVILDNDFTRQEKNEPLTLIHEGFQYGSVSMRCFQIGQT